MLNEQQVLAIVPVSPVTLWRMERDGKFPRGSYISANRKVWFEDEIVAWQAEVNGRGRGPRKSAAEGRGPITVQAEAEWDRAQAKPPKSAEQQLIEREKQVRQQRARYAASQRKASKAKREREARS